MKKAVFIINPTSGGEKALEYNDKLKQKAMEYFDEVEVKITEKADDATRYAIESAENKCDSVFAFGGDGTVNEVIAGIAERDYIPKLGIIPGGTGNLMSRLIGINLDIDKAIEELDFNSTKKFDIGKCNDKFFGYIFSIGSIPESVHNVDIEDKTKFGPLVYVANSIKSLIKDDTYRINIKTENNEFNGSASHVIVLLSNYLGEKKIFSQNTDGLGNVLILKDASLISKFSLIPDLISSDLINNENIEYFKAKNIIITSNEELETDIDGDKGDKLPVEITILKQHIDVYSPRD